MKNHWLDKNKKMGFPQDDEYSIQAGCCGNFVCNCSANLDIFYTGRFVQDEKLAVLADKSTDVTQYQVVNTPILAGTMTGVIYPTPGNTSYGFTFVVSSSGLFVFKNFEKDSLGNFIRDEVCSDIDWLNKAANLDYMYMPWYEEMYPETNLNLETGVVELHYRSGKCPEIIVSYEYTPEVK